MRVRTFYLVDTLLGLLLTPMNWCKGAKLFTAIIPSFIMLHSRKLREAGPSEDGIFQIGNKIFSVRADSTLNLSLGDQNQAVPLFGAKYNFWLHEVVDLPEYLIHMPLLIRFAMFNSSVHSTPTHMCNPLTVHNIISSHSNMLHLLHAASVCSMTLAWSLLLSRTFMISLLITVINQMTSIFCLRCRPLVQKQ